MPNINQLIINTSNFLLAGAIHFEMQQYTKDEKDGDPKVLEQHINNHNK